MKGFRDLRIYKQSLLGVKMIYELTRKSPLNRDYSLVDQIRRASYSVTANISEGNGRVTKKERAQFLTYSIGSVNEVVAFMDIINTVYPNVDTSEIKNFYIGLGKQIYVFRNKLPA